MWMAERRYKARKAAVELMAYVGVGSAEPGVAPELKTLGEHTIASGISCLVCLMQEIGVWMGERGFKGGGWGGINEAEPGVAPEADSHCHPQRRLKKGTGPPPTPTPKMQGFTASTSPRAGFMLVSFQLFQSQAYTTEPVGGSKMKVGIFSFFSDTKRSQDTFIGFCW